MSISSLVQRQKILSYLQKHGSATTVELRHELDILQPAPRVFELRHKDGHNIQTIWDEDENPNGGTHKVGRYILKTTEDLSESNV